MKKMQRPAFFHIEDKKSPLLCWMNFEPSSLASENSIWGSRWSINFHVEVKQKTWLWQSWQSRYLWHNRYWDRISPIRNFVRFYRINWKKWKGGQGSMLWNIFVEFLTDGNSDKYSKGSKKLLRRNWIMLIIQHKLSY